MARHGDQRDLLHLDPDVVRYRLGQPFIARKETT